MLLFLSVPSSHEACASQAEGMGHAEVGWDFEKTIPVLRRSIPSWLVLLRDGSTAGMARGTGTGLTGSPAQKKGKDTSNQTK